MQTKTINRIFLFNVVFLTFITQNVSAIRCFQCNSFNDSRCSEINPPKEISYECGNHNGDKKPYVLCRKIVQYVEFSVEKQNPDNRIIRECGYITDNKDCYRRGGFGGTQKVCSCAENDCNSAGLLQNRFYVIAIGTISIILFHLNF